MESIIFNNQKIRNNGCVTTNIGRWVFHIVKTTNKQGGWAAVLAKTAQLGPSQIAKLTFVKGITCQSMWWLTGAITAFELGIQFRKWHTNQITTKEFFINSGKILVVNAASISGGAGGAAMGAFIGMALGGPIGAILGSIIGGIVASLVATHLTQKLVEAGDKKYQKFTTKKVIKSALQFFQLPSKCNLATIQKSRRFKFTQYHPDKWLEEDEEKQKAMAIKLQKTMENYEILKNAIEAQLQSQKLKANKYFQQNTFVDQQNEQNIYFLQLVCQKDIKNIKVQLPIKK